MTTPVRLLPGWLKLATSPSKTGSLFAQNTIGIVVVTAFAATADGLAPATITVSG